MDTNIKQNSRTHFFILLVIVFILLKLPFDLSVTCSNHNEGFYFIYGKYLLEGDIGQSFRGPLFILLYSLIVKFFGFGTEAIISSHFLHTISSVVIGILIYVLANEFLKQSSYALLSAFIWFLLIFTPIGGWGDSFELNAILGLEAEYFCVLMSLLSIYTLFKVFSNDGQNIILPILSGLFMVASFMFKASGLVMLIAFMCWLFCVAIISPNLLKVHKKSLFFVFIGMVLGFALFFLFVYGFYGDMFLFFKNYILVGSYSQEFTKSTEGFIDNFISFMLRDESTFNGINNFIVYFLMLAGIMWTLIYICISFLRKKEIKVVQLLFIIWSVGSICAVLSPGIYGSYYHVLIWPSASMFIAILLSNIIARCNMPLITTLTILIVCLLFGHRIYLCAPIYWNKVCNSIKLNVAFQPQSFQDPVAEYDPTQFNRPPALQLADYLNRLLPDKKETIYVFNFVRGHYSFAPTLYIYMKRLPASTILCDYLYQKINLDIRIVNLKSDLTNRLPKIIVMPEVMHVPSDMYPLLESFFEWNNLFLNENYHLATTMRYGLLGLEEIQEYEIFERNG